MATPRNSSRQEDTRAPSSAGRKTGSNKNTPLPPKGVIVNTKDGKKITFSTPIFSFNENYIFLIFLLLLISFLLL